MTVRCPDLRLDPADERRVAQNGTGALMLSQAFGLIRR